MSKFLSRLTPCKRRVFWHTGIKPVIKSDEITVIPDGHVYCQDEVTYEVFGTAGEKFLVDYWQFNSQLDVDLVRSYAHLPLEYKNFLMTLLQVTKFASAIVLCVFNNMVINIFRSDEPEFQPNGNEEQGFMSSLVIKNFMLDDPLMDYISSHREEMCRLLNLESSSSSDVEDECGEPSKKKRRKRREDSVMLQVMDFSHQRVVSDIILRYPQHFYNANYSSKSTLSLIKMNVPLIYRPRLVDKSREIFSHVDLLIRYDFLNKISPRLTPPKFKKINKKIPYVPVLLVFKRVALKMDKLHACKFSKFSVTEGVLVLANQALSLIQGGSCGTGGYVLSRDGVLARVDPPPSVLEKADKAIQWKRTAIKGENLILLPKPNNIYLYPNMKTDNVDRVKTKYAETIGELTQLSFISAKNRDLAIALFNIDSLSHPDIGKLVPKNIGINGKQAQEQVLRLIRAQSLNDVSFEKKPERIKDIEAYVDFETFYDFARETTQPYMFGIWGKKDVEEWEYTSVILDSLSPLDITRFWFEVSNLLKPLKRIAAWGGVEKHLLSTSPVDCSSLEVVNLCDVCTSCGMQLPKMKNYKLKEIGKCLKSANFTSMSWEGTAYDSMTCAMRHYLHNKGWKLDQIIRYNEIDCKMLASIHMLLSAYS